MTAGVRTVGDPAGEAGAAPRRLLYGHGYALVLSSVLSSGIGFLFWIAAAHTYDQAVVGRNSALIYAIMFLGGVAQLNMVNVLLRFVPVAGPRARRLVALAYLTGGVLAGLAGLVFALGVRWWSPELAGLLRGPAAIAGCAAACAVWAFFVMQDGVLTAVGRARLVPVENLMFSVLKLGLLVALAVSLPSGGITVSWMVATVVAVLSMSGYLFLRALPAHSGVHGRTERLTPRLLAGYFSGDLLGATFWLACTQLLPVLVLGVLGARSTAVFAMAWTIAYALYLVPAAMGQSLVAHTAASVGPEEVDAARAGVERRSLTLLVPVVAVLVVAAPLVLRLLGPAYAEANRWALPLMALSALPNVVVAAEVSRARVLRRVGLVAVLMGAVSVLVLTLTLVLTPILGITGAGLALLTAQTVVAAALLLARAGWLPRPIAGPFAGLRTTALLRRIAPVVLADGPWRLQGSVRGRSDAAIARVGLPGQPSQAVLKVADTAGSRFALRREVTVLGQLAADPRLDGWQQLLPRVLDSGSATSACYSVQTLLPGTDARAHLAEPAHRQRFTLAALAALAELRRRTARQGPVDEELLGKHVTAPAALVRAVVPRRDRPVVDRLVAELTQALRGRCAAVGWVHGDYSADNVLVEADGRVTGIVDWGQATDEGLVLIDVVGLLLATEAAGAMAELGTVVTAWLGPDPAGARAVVAACAGTLDDDLLPARPLVLLAWLHLVSANLAKSTRYAANPVWLRRNIIAVLRTLAQEIP